MYKFRSKIKNNRWLSIADESLGGYNPDESIIWGNIARFGKWAIAELFPVILAQFGSVMDQLRLSCGSLAAQFGSVMDQLWITCGSVAVQFSSVVDQFGAILDHFGSIFPEFWISFSLKNISGRDTTDLVILRNISNTWINNFLGEKNRPPGQETRDRPSPHSGSPLFKGG